MNKRSLSLLAGLAGLGCVAGVTAASAADAPLASLQSPLAVVESVPATATGLLAGTNGVVEDTLAGLGLPIDAVPGLTGVLDVLSGIGLPLGTVPGLPDVLSGLGIPIDAVPGLPGVLSASATDGVAGAFTALSLQERDGRDDGDKGRDKKDCDRHQRGSAKTSAVSL